VQSESQSVSLIGTIDKNNILYGRKIPQKQETIKQLQNLSPEVSSNFIQSLKYAEKHKTKTRAVVALREVDT
jgi:hypothetical protein